MEMEMGDVIILWQFAAMALWEAWVTWVVWSVREMGGGSVECEGNGRWEVKGDNGQHQLLSLLFLKVVNLSNGYYLSEGRN